MEKSSGEVSRDRGPESILTGHQDSKWLKNIAQILVKQHAYWKTMKSNKKDKTYIQAQNAFQEENFLNQESISQYL